TMQKSLNWLKDSADNFELFYLSNFLNQLLRSFKLKSSHTDFDLGKIASYLTPDYLGADEETLITAVNEVAQINSFFEKAGRKVTERFTNEELSASKDRLIPGKVRKINRSDRKRVVLAKN
ncbi:MAG: hypothetical protein KDD94_13060, partial [Calditrichaeota bacterium]|nr:hypothetical protein [Calditrichota bacterium]